MAKGGVPMEDCESRAESEILVEIQYGSDYTEVVRVLFGLLEDAEISAFQCADIMVAVVNLVHAAQSEAYLLGFLHGSKHV